MQTRNHRHISTHSHSETPSEKRSRQRWIITQLVRVVLPNSQCPSEATVNFKAVHNRYARGREEVMPLTWRERDKERDRRERWVGRSGFTAVHVRNPWHRCLDATAAKIQKLFLHNMHVPLSEYNPQWDRIVY